VKVGSPAFGCSHGPQLVVEEKNLRLM
jgi:hypothetical protein